ncbi:AzlC family ABC transporter permease [Natrarchaeobius chitinivorans]|uniref:Branched-chain amino acid ABC transporter permease n=1 Tax=Natrarchaeobius chitinivorans TaxID=1679083 RepID=A0A3N6LX24_NATCH|nr:AzlC family ABC transporter permease [Natrarchaeobius chitinivorans]RQG92294.1 branched-chain amino acid ABC transporter permease [Natrarchaeobius chitinivorans]
MGGETGPAGSDGARARGDDASDRAGDAVAIDRRTAGNSSDGERDSVGDESDRPRVTFDREGIRTGFYTTVPVALGVGGYGIAFGVLANQAGLSVAEAALMSATVLAGASQIVAVELWADPIPVAAIVVTVFAINLRYSLMGAALQPWFRHLSPKEIYGSLFFMADENWALTMRDLTAGNGRGAFLLGSGIAIWVFWVAATIVGALAGGIVGDPTRYGFDFILAAVFVALAAELWEGRSSLAPWVVALGVSVVAAELVPGRWYILLGGLAAAVVEVIRYGE